MPVVTESGYKVWKDRILDRDAGARFVDDPEHGQEVAKGKNESVIGVYDRDLGVGQVFEAYADTARGAEAELRAGADEPAAKVKKWGIKKVGGDVIRTFNDKADAEKRLSQMPNPQSYEVVFEAALSPKHREMLQRQEQSLMHLLAQHAAGKRKTLDVKTTEAELELVRSALAESAPRADRSLLESADSIEGTVLVAKERDSGSSEPVREFTQYSVSGNVFAPSSRTTPRLDPAVYRIGSSPSIGVYLEKIAIKSDQLVKFEDARISAVTDEIRKFWGLKERYRAHGITHKRGVLLYGPPGTGKTSLLAQVIGEAVAVGHIVVMVNEHSMSETGPILQTIAGIEGDDRCVLVVMEDVDEIVNYSERQFLNLMDGAAQCDGMLFLGTTNYRERLPERALRPGRFDVQLEVAYIPDTARRDFFRFKLAKNPSVTEEAVAELVAESDGMTFAEMKELLIRRFILNPALNESRVLSETDMGQADSGMRRNPRGDWKYVVLDLEGKLIGRFDDWDKAASKALENDDWHVEADGLTEADPGETITARLKSGITFPARVAFSGTTFDVVKHAVSGRQYTVDKQGNVLHESTGLDAYKFIQTDKSWVKLPSGREALVRVNVLGPDLVQLNDGGKTYEVSLSEFKDMVLDSAPESAEAGEGWYMVNTAGKSVVGPYANKQDIYRYHGNSAGKIPSDFSIQYRLSEAAEDAGWYVLGRADEVIVDGPYASKAEAEGRRAGTPSQKVAYGSGGNVGVFTHGPSPAMEASQGPWYIFDKVSRKKVDGPLPSKEEAYDVLVGEHWFNPNYAVLSPGEFRIYGVSLGESTFVDAESGLTMDEGKYYVLADSGSALTDRGFDSVKAAKEWFKGQTDYEGQIGTGLKAFDGSADYAVVKGSEVKKYGNDFDGGSSLMGEATFVDAGSGLTMDEDKYYVIADSGSSLTAKSFDSAEAARSWYYLGHGSGDGGNLGTGLKSFGDGAAFAVVSGAEMRKLQKGGRPGESDVMAKDAVTFSADEGQRIAALLASGRPMAGKDKAALRRASTAFKRWELVEPEFHARVTDILSAHGAKAEARDGISRDERSVTVYREDPENSGPDTDVPIEVAGVVTRTSDPYATGDSWHSETEVEIVGATFADGSKAELTPEEREYAKVLLMDLKEASPRAGGLKEASEWVTVGDVGDSDGWSAFRHVSYKGKPATMLLFCGVGGRDLTAEAILAKGHVPLDDRLTEDYEFVRELSENAFWKREMVVEEEDDEDYDDVNDFISASTPEEAWSIAGGPKVVTESRSSLPPSFDTPEDFEAYVRQRWPGTNVDHQRGGIDAVMVEDPAIPDLFGAKYNRKTRRVEWEDINGEVLNEAKLSLPAWGDVLKAVGSDHEGAAYVVHDTIRFVLAGSSPNAAFKNAAENQNMYGDRPDIVAERKRAYDVLRSKYKVNVTRYRGL